MSQQNEAEVAQLLLSEFPAISAEHRQQILLFYRLLCAENEIQNLTRLTEPRAFIDGHLRDCVELLKQDWMSYPAMDLGSGGGVPGLLCAVLDGKSWVLCEAEKRKAEFLTRAVQELGLGAQVRVSATRAETLLKTETTGTVVARAVGPVDRIFGWIRGCSTWNTLILFKGPSWDEEWAAFHVVGALELAARYDYSIGPEAKRRVLVRLTRVPRGTKRKKPLAGAQKRG